MKTKHLSLLAFFGAGKLILHFFTNTNYGLHRDEFLYFDQGKHLAWGFYEVPPVTALFASLADLMGGSIFAIRLFPALAGMVIILLSCKLVKDLGGSKLAIILTGTSLLFSPSLLGTNTLFQPVSFNQLGWFLIAYLVVKVISNPNRKNYLLLGLFIGLALLTKYSAVFYLAGLVIGVLLTQQRKLLFQWPFLLCAGLSLVICVPNILWQFNHGIPLFTHMEELKETQLIHINWSHFLSSLLIEHKGFSIIWIIGIIGLFKLEKLKSYRSLAFAFIATLAIVGGLQGKPYYTLGAFLILFPFGGLAIDHFLSSDKIKYNLLAACFLVTIPFYPLSIPILKTESLKNYTQYLSTNWGINYMLRWEDGQYHELPQDFADTHGWEELASKVAKIYHSLPATERKNCNIMGGSYAHSGSLNYYRRKYNLPPAYSFNGSYLYWAKTDLQFDKQILVDDRIHESSSWFENIPLVDSIQDPYAREKGYIYFRTQPKIDVGEAWKEHLLEERGE